MIQNHAPGTETPGENKSDLSFNAALTKQGLQITPISVQTMQLNITRQCNQFCNHCHVDASPSRNERMGPEVIECCLQILEINKQITTLDITGGAPELHPGFYDLVKRARALNKNVMVRHNLTIQFDDTQETGYSKSDLPEFFAENNVEIVASLPYYQEYFTDKQRGPGVFNKSISAIKRLNQLNYGKEGSGLTLNLVYNPAGAFLPANQASLESDYKRELLVQYGIAFNHLFTLTNMPVNRFKDSLERGGILTDYMEKLKAAFNPLAAQNAMCRYQMNIDHNGNIYDCDFNQMLGLQVIHPHPVTVYNFKHDEFLERHIIFGNHCYGCTAGAGSSCGGVTT